MTSGRVDAELEILKAFGVTIRRTHTLDGKDPMWSPRQHVLRIGTDLTDEEAETVACRLLGVLAEGLAS